MHYSVRGGGETEKKAGSLPFSLDKSSKLPCLPLAPRIDVQHHDWHRPKKSPVKQQTGAWRPAWGKSSCGEVLAANPLCVVHSQSHLFPSTASWGKGNGKDLVPQGSSGRVGALCMKVGVLLSALPPPALLCSAVKSCSLPRRGSQWDREPVWDIFFMFVCFYLEWSSTGRNSDSLHPFLKCNWEEGPASPSQLPGGFSFLFLPFSSFLFSSSSRESSQNQK